MFNAYFLRDGHRASALGDVVAWVDSGGFLFLEAPRGGLPAYTATEEGAQGPSRWARGVRSL